ncbi:MAG TPA: glucan biosynthesis protein [Gammaproteobacteria bacterium]|nr:glucan biosynthesis protein [Gammaproteobacteria bacterium]
MRVGRFVGLWCAAWLVVAAAGAQERGGEPFDRNVLLERAAEIAKKPYQDPIRRNAPELKLSYDQYRSIRFRNDAAIWNNENRTFTVDLFYPGFIFNVPVNINLVVAKMARRVRFSNDLFESDANALVAGPDSAYSGFRVRAPLNRPDFMDEFLVFQGASYFRAVARGQLYGLSARGLAVRTARAEGEEFPAWTDFWIERPPEKADRITIHAILQSRSVVGAYTFVARPGNETVIDVDATLFARSDLTYFGIAPLTSMFLFDSSNRARFDDYRNAVHDSDGLQVLNGNGERIWRPLANPAALQISAFIDENPKGFGLLQRKRNFEDFQDAEALYNRRPSLWVEPKGQWGRGHVELVEIPSDREIHDNIVAYWQPEAPIKAGQKASFAYRLRFTAEPLDASLARVVATRSGAALQNQDQRSFVIDYRGRGPIPQDLKPEVWSSGGAVLNARGHVLPGTDIYRASFELDPGREDTVELRLVLTSNGKPWGETWLYRWSQ